MGSVTSTIKNFFKSKFNVYLVLILLILGTLAFFLTSNTTTVPQTDGLTVTFFYLPTCPHCADQKPIFEQLKQDLPDLNYISYDASSQEGSALFYQMSAANGLDTSRLAVPTIFVNEHALVGVHTLEQLKATVQQCQEECQADTAKNVSTQQVQTSFQDFELPFLGRTDLTNFSLPVLAVILGLVDGFNPCAMWVLVYLIGLLIGLNDKKKVWLIVGSFVLASGILYFLFMTAWINIFLLIGYIRILTLIIGLVALGGGIINLKEYWVNRGQVVCNVGDAASHQKTMTRIQKIIAQPLSIAIFFSILALAFIVNSVEFVCSAAIPAVFTQLLALHSLSLWQNYLYILIYVFFFMLDDLIIFGLAAFAVSGSFGEKYAKYCNLIGGIILTILGVIMVLAPQLLR